MTISGQGHAGLEGGKSCCEKKTKGQKGLGKHSKQIPTFADAAPQPGMRGNALLTKIEEVVVPEWV